jgi:hypothetical protein
MKKPPKPKRSKKPKRLARPDFAQTALAVVEKAIGGRLISGMEKSAQK